MNSTCTTEEESKSPSDDGDHQFEEMRRLYNALERDFKNLRRKLEELEKNQQQCRCDVSVLQQQNLRRKNAEEEKSISAGNEGAPAALEKPSDEETGTKQNEHVLPMKAEKVDQTNESKTTLNHSPQTVFVLFPGDTYSFFALGKPSSYSFLCALLVLICQALIYFFLLGRDGEEERQEGNPLNIPVNVSPGVRACQFLAILIAVVHEDGIVGTTYSRNFWWNLSALLRMLEGSLAIAVTFILILQAENARDVLLNFTAVRFVSQMDNVVFDFAFHGYWGAAIQRDATTIKEEKVAKTRRNSCLSNCLAWTILLLVLALWLWISREQGRGHFLCHRVFVEFRDDEVSELSSFNGIYTMKLPDTWGGRVEYIEDPHVVIDGVYETGQYDPAKIRYCASERAWVFVRGPVTPDLCSEWNARSPVTDSYDVTSTSFLGSNWIAKKATREISLQHFHLSCHDCNKINKDFCGAKGQCIKNKCECDNGWYGSQCDHETPCDSLVLDPNYDVFPVEHPSSFKTIFHLVKNVLFYDRPVYRGTLTVENPTTKPKHGKLIIAYTGRRWEMTLPSPAIMDLNDTITFSRMSGFHSFWSTHTVWFSSDASDAETLSSGGGWLQQEGKSFVPIRSRLICRILMDYNIEATFGQWMDYSEQHWVEVIYGRIEDWDTSHVTDMSNVIGHPIANPNISNWNTSGVVKFVGTFHGARSFNGDVSSWDVSRSTDMSKMFQSASSFNQSLSRWNTSSVEDMSRMFYGAERFDQDISSWDTAKVKDMTEMFAFAFSFNQNISNWDLSSVQQMGYFFKDAASFNREVSPWNTSSATNMRHMFDEAVEFNQSLYSWNTSSVEDMSSMFSDASSFDHDISKWDTSAVKYMPFMFHKAKHFNQDLSLWNVSAVEDAREMFSGAESFNQDLSRWNVSQIKDMSHMFKNASRFKQRLCWKLHPSVNVKGMFCGSRGRFNRTCIENDNVLEESVSGC